MDDVCIESVSRWRYVQGRGMWYQVGFLRPALRIDDELINGDLNAEMQFGGPKMEMLLMLLFDIYPLMTDMCFRCAGFADLEIVDDRVFLAFQYLLVNNLTVTSRLP